MMIPLDPIKRLDKLEEELAEDRTIASTVNLAIRERLSRLEKRAEAVSLRLMDEGANGMIQDRRIKDLEEGYRTRRREWMDQYGAGEPVEAAGPARRAEHSETAISPEETESLLAQINAWLARPCGCQYVLPTTTYIGRGVTSVRPGICRRCRIAELWTQLKEALGGTL